MSFAFLVRLNAISASTFMSLLPVGRWPRISITFAQIINLPRGITLSTYSSMKSRTFLNVRKRIDIDSMMKRARNCVRRENGNVEEQTGEEARSLERIEKAYLTIIMLRIFNKRCFHLSPLQTSMMFLVKPI